MSTTYRRPYLLLEISARTKNHDVAVVSAADFTSRLVGATDELRLDGLLPYCLDCAAERVIYTDTPDIYRALAAPFLYQGQYAGAERLASVPFERLAELETTTAMAPTFVFSVSRCGSTLLASLLHHLGQPSASEPDVFTQIAAMSADERTRVGPTGRMALIRGCTAALARQIGAGVVIKLRDHCNEIATLMAAAVPEARAAFMLRDRLGWAQSRYAAFSDSPQALADILKRGVMALDALARAGRRPILIWYEDLVGDPVGTLVRLGVPPEALDCAGPGGLEALLTLDSQAGTSLAQRPGGRRLGDADLAAFESIWASIAPRQILRRHGLERLLPPGG
jgi:hypothetical protein